MFLTTIFPREFSKDSFSREIRSPGKFVLQGNSFSRDIRAPDKIVLFSLFDGFFQKKRGDGKSWRMVREAIFPGFLMIFGS